MGTHLSVCELPKKQHQNDDNDNNMGWRPAKIDGPSLWNAIQTVELNKAELHTPCQPASPGSKYIQIPETCLCGKRISYTLAYLSKSKNMGRGLLGVSSWSIKDNYDSLGHQLSVNSIWYFTN